MQVQKLKKSEPDVHAEVSDAAHTQSQGMAHAMLVRMLPLVLEAASLKPVQTVRPKYVSVVW